MQTLFKTFGFLTAFVGFSSPALAETALPSDALGQIIVVQPLSLQEHPFKDFLPNATACAVNITDGTSERQQVITVGEGESETLSCVDFIEAGPLPELGNSIGLIYDFESGPNSIFRGAVILSLNPETHKWYRNEEFEGTLTVNSDIDTLKALREELAAK